MLYYLGILTGLILSVIVIIVTLWQRPKLERLFNQANSTFKEKGKIIEPETEVDDWIDNLKQE